MALRLLLDEHFSEQDAVQVRWHASLADVVSLHTWEGSVYLGRSDAEILTEAAQQGRTLVTRDARTIAPLLIALAQEGISHGGVIFVDHRSIPEGNTGALVQALAALWLEENASDWTKRVAHLRPVQPPSQ